MVVVVAVVRQPGGMRVASSTITSRVVGAPILIVHTHPSHIRYMGRRETNSKRRKKGKLLDRSIGINKVHQPEGLGPIQTRQRSHDYGTQHLAHYIAPDIRTRTGDLGTQKPRQNDTARTLQQQNCTPASRLETGNKYQVPGVN